MIKIEECKILGYPARTKENVCNSDVTIAIATDFNTAGERLTKKYCIENKKCYISVDYDDFVSILGIVEQINVCTYPKKEIVINIAGNGIYGLPDFQYYVDNVILKILQKVINHPQLVPKIKLIRSGGQTGIDEAGVKAAEKLNIQSLVLAPKGFLFRDKDGVDIADKQLFIERFMPWETYQDFVRRINNEFNW